MKENTSSKLRRIRRQQKLKKQRQRAALAVIFVLMLFAAHAGFSKQIKSDESYTVESVVVKEGDTLWTIAKEYKSENMDLREYVYETAKNNGIENGDIYVGQILYMPTF